jgi:hypothetical protein
MTTTTSKRPLGVSLLSFVLMVGGVLDIIAGGLLLIERNDRAVLDRTGGDPDELAVYAIVTIFVGIVVIAVAAALRNGSNFARYLVAFIAIVRVLALLFAVVSWSKGDWFDPLVPAVIYSLVAGYLLFDKDSQAFFEKPIEPPT